MTDMEKKVMVRLCAKILAETELYNTDMDVNLKITTQIKLFTKMK